jgi:hypothetical protein
VRISEETRDEIVDVTVPGGRFVTIDCRKLLAWARGKGLENLGVTYAAQPCAPRDDAPFLPTPPPTEILGPADLPRLPGHEIFVPEGYGAVAFLFPRDPLLTVEAGLSEGGGVPMPDSGRIEAPVPSALLDLTAPLTFVLTMGGERFRQAGVDVDLHGATGSLTFRTDEEGVARGRVLPGRYAYSVGSIGIRSRYVRDWPVVEVRDPSKETRIQLDFEYAR